MGWALAIILWALGAALVIILEDFSKSPEVARWFVPLFWPIIMAGAIIWAMMDLAREARAK